MKITITTTLGSYVRTVETYEDVILLMRKITLGWAQEDNDWRGNK